MNFLRRFSYSEVALVFLLSLSWFLFFWMKQMRREATLLLEHRTYPPSLVGLKMNVEQYSRLVYSWPSDYDHSSRKRTLVLAMDDGCGICRTQYSVWARLINKLNQLDGFEVLLVSFNGELLAKQLADLLRERGISHRFMKVAAHHTFGVLTGIKSVPFTALLDQSERLLMLSDNLDEQTIRELSQAIATSNDMTVKHLRVFQETRKEVKQ